MKSSASDLARRFGTHDERILLLFSPICGSETISVVIVGLGISPLDPLAAFPLAPIGSLFGFFHLE